MFQLNCKYSNALFTVNNQCPPPLSKQCLILQNLSNQKICFCFSNCIVVRNILSILQIYYLTNSIFFSFKHFITQHYDSENQTNRSNKKDSSHRIQSNALDYKKNVSIHFINFNTLFAAPGYHLVLDSCFYHLCPNTGCESFQRI